MKYGQLGDGRKYGDKVKGINLEGGLKIMKAFERIFLYSILTILVFYVFFVDGNVESKAAIQDEIRARSIVIELTYSKLSCTLDISS